MTKIEKKQMKDYAENFLIVASQIYYWRQAKPDNDELKAISLCVQEMNTYTQGLELSLQSAKELLKEEES